MYLNLFTDYNCMYQDFDMSAGAHNVQSQQNISWCQSPDCLHCAFTSFVDTASHVLLSFCHLHQKSFSSTCAIKENSDFMKEIRQ